VVPVTVVHGWTERLRAIDLMALAATFRAVAESGRGNDADAAWDLHVAHTFVFASRDLAHNNAVALKTYLEGRLAGA
jgi:hypothetical protein